MKDAPPRMRVFRDITVVPTQGLRHGMGRLPGRLTRGLFRGGPIWPFFTLQVRARHCRGPIPFPYDLRPTSEPVVHHKTAGIWCGPASPHFGHMIADFAMRLPEAAHAETDWPLVFSVGPAARPEPTPFFWDILSHFGVPPEQVVLVGEATHFETLAVPPQAERLGGTGPSRRHLDRMDAVAAALGPPGAPIPCLFVTRAGLTDGRLAAEPYLAERLEAAGVTVMRPEALPLPEQIDAYRRAERIVFSEGSAVHALQLLGRLPARIAILVRRPGRRLARATLRPRLASLAYWDCTLDQMTGRNRHGRPQWDRALTLFDPRALIARLTDFGIDLSAQWDERRYRAALRDDLERWIAYNHLLDHHPSGRAAIARNLERVRRHFED
ncbi:glycosyltransferase family 61 protein [Methylobacterium sp. Leaf456]|uniref:glycosyltransferase 61 family protein n=1 Tax=Methylobacterium sp. Leaf456 TaxID=1736382 RepID=UPI0009EBBB9F|nr:glycosyltransferase family 61 protein [Methylobacterium sp. Leaf456]